MNSGALAKQQTHNALVEVPDSTACHSPIHPAENSPNLEELINEIIKRDEAALLALYDRVSTPLYSLALTMLDKEEHACEVLQETFAWIWANARKFRTYKGSAFSWLVYLVRKRALIRVRNDRPSNALVEYCATVLQGVDTESNNQHMRRNSKIRQEFRALPEHEQRVLKLAFFGGFNQREIAEKIDASPESIRKYAFQGLARLHDAIKNLI